MRSLCANLAVISALCVLAVNATPARAQELPFSGDVTVVADDTSKPLLAVLENRAAERLSASGESRLYVGYRVETRESLRKAEWSRHDGGCRSVTIIDGVRISHNDEGIKRVGSEYKAVLYKYGKSGTGAKLERLSILDMYDEYRFTVPLLWLQSVEAGRSLVALGELSAGGLGENISEDALPAVALHKGEEPKRILKGIVFGNRSLDLREDALFWFGFTLDPGDISGLKEMETSLDHPDLREKLTFVYYLQKSEPAIERMIHMARNDKSRDVREQAIFWLGQLAGAKIADELEDIVENDPEIEIKKQAVFALSQMDTPDSIDRLMKIARTNESPTVRKQALFWLSQSSDERAVELLEEILLK
jgi:hypothetical protein